MKPILHMILGVVIDFAVLRFVVGLLFGHVDPYTLDAIVAFYLVVMRVLIAASVRVALRRQNERVVRAFLSELFETE